VNFQSAVVFNEAKVSKLIHETSDMRPRRTDHLRQRFMTYLGHNTRRLAFLFVAGEQQKDTSQSFLIWVKMQVSKVCFVADVAVKQIGD
jgi:hypothetical protein